MEYALITGAASGIGRAIAEQLAQKSYQLLLVDIDEERLNKVAKTLQQQYQVDIQILKINLAQTAASDLIKAWSEPFHDRLSVLVNNAAFGLNGAFKALSLDEQLEMINVNVKAVVALTHTFIPILEKRDAAYLLNVGSNGAYQPVPFLNVYAASKAFILSFTRSLRYELKGTSITVSCLTAGSTDTNFINRAGMGASVRKTAERIDMTPDEVAEIGLKGLFKKRPESIAGFNTWLGITLTKIFPVSLAERFGANIFKPK